MLCKALALGYTYEGIAGYLYPDTAWGALPLYRLNSASDKEHFYTMSDEGNTASVVNGYHFEGIAGHPPPFLGSWSLVFLGWKQ